MKLLPYRGRFAPSPTGELHFGSLVAALGSYCQARANNGEWILRIEDVDTTRRVAGSADSIIRSLDRLGFQWDGEVIYQSQRAQYYAALLDQLITQKNIFFCTCSRTQLAREPGHSNTYPGYCRERLTAPREAHAIRCRVSESVIQFHDAVQGDLAYELSKDCGDFILKRRDGLFAYQLAVVADDADQAITEVVRGADLLDSTPLQIYLQQLLGLPTPSYLHLPVAMHKQGHKLSKSHQDLGLQSHEPQALLVKAAHFLNQNPPDALMHTSLDELWDWLITHWDYESIPKQRQLAGQI